MQKVFFLLAIFLATGCDDSPKVHIKTTSIAGWGIHAQRDSITTELNSEYFEIGLNSYRNGEYYIAEKKPEDIFDEKNLKNNSVKLLEIVENDSVKRFTNSTQFLNYMSKGGYEMVEQQKFRHHIEYTFKKKP